MLTQADDYPIHQLPEPVATAGTDRNFYDRYYFQGYSSDQRTIIGAALGVYPHFDLMDAQFMVQHDGVQYSVFASKHMHSERMNMQVGPITLQVVEPLKRLRLKVQDAEHGVHADVMFDALSAPIEEPRFTHRAGPRTILDLTRMTQSGTWQGQVQANGTTHTLQGWRGTRDRSWGVRPLGARDAQPVPGAGPTQWYWLWVPMHFEDHLMFFHTNDDAHGNGWNRSAVLISLRDQQHKKLYDVQFTAHYREGTQQVRHCEVRAKLPDGTPVRVALDAGGAIVPKQGEGYNHPTWGHSMFHKAPLATHYEVRNTLQGYDLNDFANVHRFAMCTAQLHIGEQAVRSGQATLEQMLLGEHKPSGFAPLPF